MTRPLRLDDALAGRLLLDHPFYRRWTRGEVSREELRAYASQYRHFERALPGWLSTMALSDEPSLRAQALRNLADEAGGAVTHLQLFERFASALGAAEAEASPAMARLCETYAAAARSAPHGFAALWAYESQSAAVSRTKAAGLRAHHGLDDGACAFWDVHASVEDEHAAWAREALAGTEDAPATARAAAQAWWSFLDEREAAYSAASTASRSAGSALS